MIFKLFEDLGRGMQFSPALSLAKMGVVSEKAGTILLSLLKFLFEKQNLPSLCSSAFYLLNTVLFTNKRSQSKSIYCIFILLVAYEQY